MFMFCLDGLFSNAEQLVRALVVFSDEELAREYLFLSLCFRAIESGSSLFHTEESPEFLFWLNWYEQYLLQEISCRFCRNHL